jgi:putative tricarboxylic transport membrane protein
MASDRIFGLVVIVVALAYIASALQIQSSFMTDPVGPRAFPILVASIAILAAIVIAARPDAEPEWPSPIILGRLFIALVGLVAYAYALKPGGFLVPTAAIAALLSYLIVPRAWSAVVTGIGLSVGLYLIFKYALGLSLFGLPRWLVGY